MEFLAVFKHVSRAVGLVEGGVFAEDAFLLCTVCLAVRAKWGQFRCPFPSGIKQFFGLGDLADDAGGKCIRPGPSASKLYGFKKGMCG